MLAHALFSLAPVPPPRFFHSRIATELLKSYLAGGKRITAAAKPTEIATIEIFDKTHGLRFLYESHLYFLICVQKNKHTAPIYCSVCGGIKTFKAHREDHVATRLPYL